jgi:glycosyltransferase involved in cell wall biosynthesis
MRRKLVQMRAWDVAASRRVTYYLANSELTRERIRRFYGRESTVIHPPVETHRFTPGVPGESLLVVSELVPHKRLRLVLEAARTAAAPISIVGLGPDHGALVEAYPEAQFLGRVSDQELSEHYASARAVVVPSVEEFGITAVEAQAAGRPVIAARGGGALETVREGDTGLLFTPDDVAALAAAIEAIDSIDFSPALAVENAESFSVASFQRRLADFVSSRLREREGARAPS